MRPEPQPHRRIPATRFNGDSTYSAQHGAMKQQPRQSSIAPNRQEYPGLRPGPRPASAINSKDRHPAGPLDRAPVGTCQPCRGDPAYVATPEGEPAKARQTASSCQGRPDAAPDPRTLAAIVNCRHTRWQRRSALTRKRSLAASPTSSAGIPSMDMPPIRLWGLVRWVPSAASTAFGLVLRDSHRGPASSPHRWTAHLRDHFAIGPAKPLVR